MAVKRREKRVSSQPKHWENTMISRGSRGSAGPGGRGKWMERQPPRRASSRYPGCPPRKHCSPRYAIIGPSRTPCIPSRACRHTLPVNGQLDVSFREDAARNRKDNAPGNIAVLRRRALDVVRRDTSKTSLSIKLKRAGWDDTFLRQLLNNIAVT